MIHFKIDKKKCRDWNYKDLCSNKLKKIKKKKLSKTCKKKQKKKNINKNSNKNSKKFL